MKNTVAASIERKMRPENNTHYPIPDRSGKKRNVCQTAQFLLHKYRVILIKVEALQPMKSSVLLPIGQFLKENRLSRQSQNNKNAYKIQRRALLV